MLPSRDCGESLDAFLASHTDLQEKIGESFRPCVMTGLGMAVHSIASLRYVHAFERTVRLFGEKSTTQRNEVTWRRDATSQRSAALCR